MSLNDIENNAWKNFIEGKGECLSNLQPIPEALLSVSLDVLFRVGKIVRTAQMYPDRLEIAKKLDGSVVTNIDMEAEQLAKKTFERVFPGFHFIGEETGGEFNPEKAISIAMDPIDGTHRFISNESSYAVALTIFQYKKILLGAVMSPHAGEIAYGFEGGPSRLVQLPAFGGSMLARNLPSAPSESRKNVLVNLQTTGIPPELHEKMQKAFTKRQIKFMKHINGSPVIGLMEAAKGNMTYVHNWRWGTTNAHDISAGAKLVQNAGGEVVDLNGNAIDPIGHSGVYVAGVDKKNVEAVLKILNAT